MPLKKFVFIFATYLFKISYICKVTFASLNKELKIIYIGIENLGIYSL